MLGPQKQFGAAIIGLGNVLLTDDGVGVHAIRQLQQDPPQGIILAEVGTALLDTLDLLESVDLVVAIDAVQAGGAPGSVHCFDLADADIRQGLSLHDFGIAAAVQSLPAEARPAVTILGVEPAVLDYGMQLSPAVQAALPHVVRQAPALIAQRIEKASQQRECNCEKV
jgi:hydrogenase maturation protease